MSDIDGWVNDIHCGDALAVLRELPASSVHMAMCSPPYYGLRDYGDETITVWDDDPNCEHDWVSQEVYQDSPIRDGGDPLGSTNTERDERWRTTGRCTECCARREQLGLEERLEDYIKDLVSIGRELRRVLRPDGSWWLNLGDTYAGGGGVSGKPGEWDDLHDDSNYPDDPPAKTTRFPRKCKMLVPHRVAISLANDGWIIRQDIPWVKRGTPHWARDRFRVAHEMVFHLTQRPTYWHDPEPFDDWAVFEAPPAQFPDAHFAVYPESLCRKPIRATCPEKVCSQCGDPYEREIVETDVWEVNDPQRPQLKRALELADEHGLTEEHLKACRSVGFSDAGYGRQQTGAGRNIDRVERLAAEAKEALGGYFREFATVRKRSNGMSKVCDCDTDTTQPGIVLDPFAGAGTTCLVAKRLGRRFIGIDLNPEYVAMAQRRVGIDVDEPELLLEDNQPPIGAFTDGGDTA